MLFSIFKSFGNNPRMAVIQLLLLIPSLLIALTVHEYAHGRMALALGDKTALAMGRLSLNPLHHLDPIGTFMLLFFGFGFAKPVPVNLRNITKVNYKLGTVLVSIAGPLSNFILAFIGVFGLLTVNTISANLQLASTPSTTLNLLVICFAFFQIFSLINIGLGIFNLIPIPPLDASRIITIFLPVKAQVWFHNNEHIIRFIFLVLFFTDVLDRFLIGFRSIIFDGMVRILSLLPFFN